MNKHLEHFRWIVHLANRIISNNDANQEISLLSLSFTKNIKTFNVSKLKEPKNVQDMKEGVAYLILTSIFSESSVEISDPKTNFKKTLLILKSIGYCPQNPCKCDNLENGNIEDHINLCKTIEFAVSDKSNNIDVLVTDLRLLPRSFYVLKSRPNFLDEAISLWMSKFPCLHDLPYIENLQADTANGMHIAAILSRAFPSHVSKHLIHCNKNPTDIEIKENWALINPLLEELGCYIPNTFDIDDVLFFCFFADIFNATRPSSKKFVKLDTSFVPLPSFAETLQRISQRPYIMRPMSPNLSDFMKQKTLQHKETDFRPKTTEIKRERVTIPRIQSVRRKITFNKEEKEEVIRKEKNKLNEDSPPVVFNQIERVKRIKEVNFNPHVTLNYPMHNVNLKAITHGEKLLS